MIELPKHLEIMSQEVANSIAMIIQKDSLLEDWMDDAITSATEVISIEINRYRSSTKIVKKLNKLHQL